MCRPNEHDVAEAILNVANGNGFRPSEVGQFLQNSGRFQAEGKDLSKQIQQPLRSLSERNYIAFDMNYNQRNNRPYIIKSREGLQNLVGRQEVIRHEPTAAAAIDSRLQEIEQMLGQVIQKVDQLSIKANRDVAAFYKKLDPRNQDRFDRLLHFASTTAIQHGREFRVRIARNNDQPRHFRNVQSVVFAKFSNEGRARPGTKMYAIPLVSDENRPITIIIRNPHRSPQACTGEIESTADRFRPYNLDHFLDNPAHYFSYEAGQN